MWQRFNSSNLKRQARYCLSIKGQASLPEMSTLGNEISFKRSAAPHWSLSCSDIKSAKCVCSVSVLFWVFQRTNIFQGRGAPTLTPYEWREQLNITIKGSPVFFRYPSQVISCLSTYSVSYFHVGLITLDWQLSYRQVVQLCERAQQNEFINKKLKYLRRSLQAGYIKRIHISPQCWHCGIPFISC